MQTPVECSVPSPSDTPESALEFIVAIAKDYRFSDEYVGNVVRSWLPLLLSTNNPVVSVVNTCCTPGCNRTIAPARYHCARCTAQGLPR